MARPAADPYRASVSEIAVRRFRAVGCSAKVTQATTVIAHIRAKMIRPSTLKLTSLREINLLGGSVKPSHRGLLLQ